LRTPVVYGHGIAPTVQGLLNDYKDGNPKTGSLRTVHGYSNSTKRYALLEGSRLIEGHEQFLLGRTWWRARSGST